MQTVNKVWYNDGTGFKEMCIDQGYYPSIEEVITQMDKAIKSNGDDVIIFQYNSITRRVKVHIKPNYVLRLQEGLAQILGLPALENISQTMTAPHAVDINRGITGLYVYCDLCEPQIVGDSLSPLLRIVDSKGKDGQLIVKMYNQPHFVPLRKKYIDVIEINISDDTGNIISFTSGKVICKLHIRLKQPNIF